ncbi:MAG: PEP-CTERM-box response regulator transcription factor [Nitrospiraceae bacterium]|nr:PEP-CTERM-box response regulator transcription factor [Nitrospiraceae bacterium]
MEKIIIIDDNEEIRRQLKWGLGTDYTVFQADSRPEALKQIQKHRPKVVTLDLGLPPHENSTEEGLLTLSEIVKEYPHTKVVVITGNGQRVNALKAIRAGAYDYYEKPVDLQELKVIINRAFHLYDIEEENRNLRDGIDMKGSGMLGLMGECQDMQRVFSTIRKIGPSDVSVLVIGESGTGKELVARAIHAMSMRKSGPFISINCGAIPDNLLESELFGHEKGAFTGAHSQLQGKVEYAEKGTLFLDEIGELPAKLQVKLLRFLQERTIQRLGGREDIHVDTRILAATNIDIQKAISEKTFREDLYYRLGVLTLKLPPLRERGSDIMLLTNLFVIKFSQQFGKKVEGLSRQAQQEIEAYDWPGNVRELENRLQRAVIMADSKIIDIHDLGFAAAVGSPKKANWDGVTLKEAKGQVEKEFIINAINKWGGNLAKTAEELGVTRPTLYDLIKKHGVSGQTGGRAAEETSE